MTPFGIWQAKTFPPETGRGTGPQTFHKNTLSIISQNGALVKHFQKFLIVFL
jgi:hypothetical protein